MFRRCKISRKLPTTAEKTAFGPWGTFGILIGFAVLLVQIAAPSDARAATLLRLETNGKVHKFGLQSGYDISVISRLGEKRDTWKGTVVSTGGVSSVDFDISSFAHPVDFRTLGFDAGEQRGEDRKLAVGVYEGAIGFCHLSDPPICGPSLKFSHNGKTVAPYGRGVLELKKRFEVLEAVFGVDGEVLRFAANFEQLGREGSVLGQIRYNSDVPIPEPSGMMLAVLGMAGAAFMVRPRHRSALVC